jgi:hypothetical protein
MIVGGISNPNSTRTTGYFILRTYDNLGNVICVNAMNVSYTASAGTLTVVGNITRSSAQVGSAIAISI